MLRHPVGVHFGIAIGIGIGIAVASEIGNRIAHYRSPITDNRPPDHFPFAALILVVIICWATVMKVESIK